VSNRKRLTGAVIVTAVVVALIGVVLAVHSPNKTAAKPPASTSPSTAPQSTTTTTLPTGGQGFLHTSGTDIETSTGSTVQLTGMNVQGMESTNIDGSEVPGQCNDAWKPLTPAEVDGIAAYGFTTVRLPIAWGNLEPTAPTVGSGGALVHHWNSAYVAALHDEVQLLGAAHLQVILDMHQASWGPAFLTPSTSKKPSCPGEGMPTWLNPNAANETSQKASCEFYSGTTEPGVPGTAWGDFAAAEAYIDGYFAQDSTVVGQDVVNEPSCGKGTANLNGFYAEVAPAIRAASPHILIILEDRDDPGTFLLTKLPPVADLVLSIHLHEDYWTSPSAGQQQLAFGGQAALEANVARSRQWQVPLYVGEFYAFDGTGSQSSIRQSDANFVSDTTSFVSYCKLHNVSWTFWAWTQKNHPQQQPDLTPEVLAALAARP
jgi:aryl-phospho-beta-D-glucosidase BglC (GH1 family)